MNFKTVVTVSMAAIVAVAATLGAIAQATYPSKPIKIIVAPATEYDVAVVGAGLAGSIAALALSQGGLRVA